MPVDGETRFAGRLRREWRGLGILHQRERSENISMKREGTN